MNALWWAENFAARHVTEDLGNNRGKLVDVFERFVHIPLGSSWCAAFASYCFHKAYADALSALRPAGATALFGSQVDEELAGKLFPFSGGSQAILRSFKENGLASDDPQDLMNWKGALGGWTDPGGAHGHVFLVAGRLQDGDGNVVRIQTVEGNAGPGRGSVVKLARNVPTTSEGHDVWFLNTSDFIGGAWW